MAEFGDCWGTVDKQEVARFLAAIDRLSTVAPEVHMVKVQEMREVVDLELAD